MKLFGWIHACTDNPVYGRFLSWKLLMSWEAWFAGSISQTVSRCPKEPYLGYDDILSQLCDTCRRIYSSCLQQ